ncbi:polysaccharide biosynthesis/export family protein [Castellaniella sp. UC4442_H9]|jgi:polysaccharide export outer membrane protein
MKHLTLPYIFRRCRRIPRAGFTLLVAAVLSGCSMAPGMYMGSPEHVSETLKSDAAPAGALTTITPALVRQQQEQEADPVSEKVRDLFGSGSAYRIGPGDILNIIIWGHPELSMVSATSNVTTGSSTQVDLGNGYDVSADGYIQFPYLGPVLVKDLTTYQIRSLIMQRIATYVSQPQVTVRVQAYRHDRIYVDGEVRLPGLQTVDDIPPTLPEVINRAGGFTENSDRSDILLTRGDQTIRISLPHLIRTGINPQSILLRDGDMLRVGNQSNSRVYVLGEALKAQSEVLQDGHLTLAQALGEAGGVTPETSNPRQIYVIRRGEQGNAQIYHLDAKSPIAYVLAAGFQLKPHDVVYVDPAPIVRWNRVINNLLPSYGVVYTSTVPQPR